VRTQIVPAKTMEGAVFGSLNRYIYPRVCRFLNTKDRLYPNSFETPFVSQSKRRYSFLDQCYDPFKGTKSGDLCADSQFTLVDPPHSVEDPCRGKSDARPKSNRSALKPTASNIKRSVDVGSAIRSSYRTMVRGAMFLRCLSLQTSIRYPAESPQKQLALSNCHPN
jgi:hypothetical protein